MGVKRSRKDRREKKIEEKAAHLLTAVRKRGLSNTEEAATTAE